MIPILATLGILIFLIIGKEGFNTDITNEGDITVVFPNEKNKNKIIKSVSYDGIDVTEAFNEKQIGTPILQDQTKVKILELVGRKFDRSKYVSTQERFATYKNFKLGKVKNLSEVSSNKLLELEDITEEKIHKQKEDLGQLETRTNIYELCKPVFSYYLCLKKNIRLDFSSYGERSKGRAPNPSLENQKTVNQIIKQYPELTKYIKERELKFLIQVGFPGREARPAKYTYDEHMDITESYERIGKALSEYTSLEILSTFQELFSKKDFIPYKVEPHPLYDGEALSWLVKGRSFDSLTSFEIAKTLGWKDESLKISYL